MLGMAKKMREGKGIGSAGGASGGTMAADETKKKGGKRRRRRRKKRNSSSGLEDAALALTAVTMFLTAGYFIYTAFVPEKTRRAPRRLPGGMPPFLRQ